MSAALRDHILPNFDVDESEFDATLEETTHVLIENESEEAASTSKSEELAERLSKEQEITLELLVQTLRQGEISLFEAMFVKITGLRPQLVRRIVFEEGGEELAISCKAVGITKPDFATVFLLSRKSRPGDKVVDPNELSQVLNFFERVKQETTQKVVKR